MSDRMFGLRRLAALLASSHDSELLAALGVAEPPAGTRQWARDLLDGVEDFWEVYDADPDGGARADGLEAELRDVAGPCAPALIRAGLLASRTSEGDLREWLDAFDLMTLERPTKEPLDRALRDRVEAVVEEAGGWPAGWRLVPSGAKTDRWEDNFAARDGFELGDTATTVVDLVHVYRLVQALHASLSADEQRAFEAWANAEIAAYQPVARPTHWPPPVLLNLATAARDIRER